MKIELRSFQVKFQESAKTKNVEHLWMMFKNKVHLLMESHIPSKTLRANIVQKPWVSRQVKTLMCKARKCSKDSERQRKPKKSGSTKKQRHSYKKTVRQSYWQYVDNMIEIGDPDQQHQPKQNRFWSYIKSFPKDTGGVAPLKDNERLHADPKEKANILNRQYESTWTREDKTSIPVPDG